MILSKQVGVYLNQGHCLFKQFIHKSFIENGFDITPEQFLVMDTLWDEGVLNQQQIADYIQKDKNSVTKLIDGLEKRGLAVRIAAGTDRRSKNIVLTKQAEEIKAKVVNVAMQAVEQICNGISQKEITRFVYVLDRMIKNMSAEATVENEAQTVNTLFDRLMEDYRFREGLNACINCGTCAAICPAAEFYKYDPRQIANLVQSRDDAVIEDLLKSEAIWYCGECMSCVPRCPRKNAPGLIIMALRSLSQELGYFTESEKGRQQLVLKRAIGGNVLNYGYCIYPRTFDTAYHPESGTVSKWVEENLDEVHKRLGSNLDGDGPGILRKIPQSALDELKAIFDVTGATKRFEKIESCSKQKAAEMGLSDEAYFQQIATKNSQNHSGKKQSNEY